MTQNIEGNKTIATLIWVTAQTSLGNTDLDIVFRNVSHNCFEIVDAGCFHKYKPIKIF